MELERIEQALGTTGDHEEHVWFPNGRGVSIVRHKYSYGGRSGLFELAVLKREGESWDLDYSTPVTDDVLGWLGVSEVVDAMRQVAELPAEVEQ